MRFVASIVLLLLLTTNIASALAEEKPDAKPASVRLLEPDSVFGGGLTGTKVFFGKLPNHRAAFCQGRAMDKPETFTSEMQLAAAIEGDDIVGRIAKQIDFEKEQLILIAWKGHGAQSINAHVDAKGEIEFLESNSHTDAAKLAKDHVYFYAVAKGAKWKVAKEPDLPVCLPPPEPKLPPAAELPPRVLE